MPEVDFHKLFLEHEKVPLHHTVLTITKNIAYRRLLV